MEDIGYNEFFKNNRRNKENKIFTPAKIIAEHQELYILRTETFELSAKITGKMIFTALSRENLSDDWRLGFNNSS